MKQIPIVTLIQRLSKLYEQNKEKEVVKLANKFKLEKAYDSLPPELQFPIAKVLAASYTNIEGCKTAKKWIERLEEVNPESAKVTKGIWGFRCGDLKTGFEHYQYRYLPDKDGKQHMKIEMIPSFPYAKKYEDYNGKRVWVHYEQGYGDMFMFSLAFPDLCKVASKVTVMTPKDILPIFKEVYPTEEYQNLEFVEKEKVREQWAKTPDHLIIEWFWENYDIQSPMGDVFAFHYLHFGDVPKSKRLFSTPENGPIGIAPLPDCKGEQYKHKLLPYSLFKPFDSKILVSKVYKCHPKPPKTLENAIKDVFSFYDTLQVLKSCKEVHSTDTSIAHLCGIYGIPCKVILKDYKDWRWRDVDLYESCEVIDIDEYKKIFK